MNYSTYQQKTPPHTRCQVVMFDLAFTETRRGTLYVLDFINLTNDTEAVKEAIFCDHPIALIRNEDGSHTVLARDVFELSYEPVN